MSNEELFLFLALQRSLCECLIYSNRTAVYAKAAGEVAEKAAVILRGYGLIPLEVPTVRERSIHGS